MISRLKSRRLKFVSIITASVLFTLVFTLAVSTKTSAQTNPQDYGLKSTAQMAGLPVGETDPVKAAATVINVVLGLVGVLAVILIIYAGFSWMTAAGNEEKIKTARKILTGAIAGLLIIMASFIISSFVMKNIQEATKGNGNGGGTADTCLSLAGQCIDPKVTLCNKNLNTTSDCASPKACCYGQVNAKTCTDLSGTCVDPTVSGSCDLTTKSLNTTADCSSPKACCY